jgi:hypothetical protein
MESASTSTQAPREVRGGSVDPRTGHCAESVDADAPPYLSGCPRSRAIPSRLPQRGLFLMDHPKLRADPPIWRLTPLSFRGEVNRRTVLATLYRVFSRRGTPRTNFRNGAFRELVS